MTLELVTIPCLSDNYAYLLHDSCSGDTAVIDVPEAAPILAALDERGWRLSDIFLTHHHDDHIAGVPKLRAATGARVSGARADAHRLPPLERALRDGDTFTFGGAQVQVIETPGHTVGHICFIMKDALTDLGTGLAFTGDTLMSGGCGRLFEGSPLQMLRSLERLAALPPETVVCSGHEYTASNMRFAAHLLPNDAAIASRRAQVDAARAQNRATVPTLLSEERRTNPFLRAHEIEVKRALGMEDASDEVCFTYIRRSKDQF